MSGPKVHIEYCGGWGYAPRYRELAHMIKAAVPGAQVHGQVGRQTSFEVKVNDQEIFSKLKTYAFPDFKDVVNIVKDVSEGGKPSTVEKTESCCVIL